MKKNHLRTNAIFHCTVKFKNGMHKILRATIDTIASITTEFRECKKNIFAKSEKWIMDIPGYGFLNISDIAEIRFTNERTKEEFLTLA